MRGLFLGKNVLALAVVALVTSPPVAASPYTSMVVFGDSLSDSGNADIAVGSTVPAITGNTFIPSHPYDLGTFKGTFSNGPVWAQTVANALSLPLAPSFAPGGTNFALGGATTTGMVGQAAAYFVMSGDTASANALYVVAGGGNDARAVLTGADPLTTIQTYVQNLTSIVGQLEAKGAKHIIVWDTPNLGLAPAVKAAPGGAAAGTGIALAMNQALLAAMANFADVSIFDIFGLGTALSANPGAFGFTNATDACGAIALADCSKYAYWDGIHPTTAAQDQIAAAFLAQAVPETSTWAMLLLGFAGVGFMAYRRRNNAMLAAA